MLSALRNLFGGEEPHFSLAWEPSTQPLLLIDLARGAVGALKFGDPPEAAQFFGRPDEARPTESSLTLVYLTRGFELEFELGRFVELHTCIGPGPSVPEFEGLQFCRPRLSNGGELTPAMNPAALQAALGEPTYGEVEDEEEPLLTYEVGNLAHEFWFNAEGALSKWSFMENEPA